MKILALCFLVTLSPLRAQDDAAVANIDEAFRLAGVRKMLESLPSHVNEMTAAAVAQFPKDKRQQFEPVIKDVSLKFLDPDSFYRQLRTYFRTHDDASHLATFLALERTPVYRTMHRLEEGADTAEGRAAIRRFAANLKSDPPSGNRVEVLQRLDEATNSTGLQVRIVIGILNAMSAGLGARMPADLETQSTAFTARIRPILANNILIRNLFVYRNADDADLEDYITLAQQTDVAWFNHNLQSAILAVVADRAARAGEYIKTKVSSKPSPMN